MKRERYTPRQIYLAGSSNPNTGGCQFTGSRDGLVAARRAASSSETTSRGRVSIVLFLMRRACDLHQDAIV
ncbi:hypothetical protein EVAR_33034_1 [Eumeta japonica]|uniref:Uncharacterized protein n=1 Tax=Eumeta variegata TaxID=151549 RepID=A0A4C1VQA9_EUMVA|nr:hypothetical protein EVAR_33034_1 [Eumeta japonica]